MKYIEEFREDYVSYIEYEKNIYVLCLFWIIGNMLFLEFWDVCKEKGFKVWFWIC